MRTNQFMKACVDALKQNATYYDVRLISVSADAGLVLEYQGGILELIQIPDSVYSYYEGYIGLIGVAESSYHSQEDFFHPYIDQSMRRLFELDHHGRIGWCNSSHPFGWTAPYNIIPGADGAFIDNQTQPITIDVPEEFFTLCQNFSVDPSTVLRSFIGDACALENYVSEPRADRYGSNGSDERDIAIQYMFRTFDFS